MLEGLAAWVLNTYVGEYLENLNTDQLSIGLLQGAVELENLPLKKDALKSLDLPIEVKAGFVGKISLQIPVRRLKSEPWVISLDKVYLVAGPLSHKKYDEEKEQKIKDERKRAQLLELETKWKVARQAHVETSSWLSLGYSLVSNIVENLQLKVNNVHIRYEDNQTIPGCSFACGIRIKSLSAQSTDGSWVPKFVHKAEAGVMHKLLDLQDFSIYWDTDAKLCGDMTSMQELADVLIRDMGQSASTGIFKDHNFILESVNAEAKMKRNTSELPIRSTTTPRINLDIKLQQLPISLSEGQYRGMVAWMKEFDRYEKHRIFMKWRPFCTVIEDPKAWWLYAINSNLFSIQERCKRQSKEYILQRARDNVVYVEGYRRELKNEYLTPSQIAVKEKLLMELSFEELKILHELAMELVTAEEKHKEREEQKKQEKSKQNGKGAPQAQQHYLGMFQGWWSGWGGASTTAAKSTGEPPPQDKEEKHPLPELDEDEPPAKIAKHEIEQEIMDVFHEAEENTSLLKRDFVFARLNFCLQSGSFQLKGENAASLTTDTHGSSPLLVLECTNIKMEFESRPRFKSLLFGISVDGLVLKDLLTPNTVMPILISPQMRDRSSQVKHFFTGFGGVGADQHPQEHGGALFSHSRVAEEAIFQFEYEQKPLGSTADHRVFMKTKPLNIVYNPFTIKRVREFFKQRATGIAQKQSEIHLAVDARRKYEELKNQTKAELKHTLDQMLEGKEQRKAKRWEFNLDITAPQFVCPENFQDHNTTLVVFDFGHLYFRNSSAKIKKKDMEMQASIDDDDEDFQTPSSTPPGEEEETADGEEDSDNVSQATTVTSNELSELLAANLPAHDLRSRLYDKYILELTELQVMVGKGKDNWKQAHYKGSGHMHILDRFTISLQFERRLLYTDDPSFPSASMSGNMPSLVMHVNEQKVKALRKCIDTISSDPVRPSPTTTPSPATPDTQHTQLGQSTYQLMSEAQMRQRREVSQESVLLLLQFTISQMALDIQSRGLPVAEIQVSGVSVNATKRTFDTSAKFSLHSLLVVDAMQTFGRDFELLVASHKRLSLDSHSGSMRDSEPTSPTSPHSPQSPQSPCSPQSPSDKMLASRNPQTSLSAFQSAFTTAWQSLNPLAARRRERSYSFDPDRAASPVPQQQHNFIPVDDTNQSEDALIYLELEQVEPGGQAGGGNEETERIINLQFNNLDVVVNQETIVELLRFFKEIAPPQAQHKSKKHSKKSESLVKSMRSMNKSESILLNPGLGAMKTTVTADVRRLNVMLMRVVENDYAKEAKKVAMATMSRTKFCTTFHSTGEKMCFDAYLGGLQLKDLTYDGPFLHRKTVFSVGHDPECSTNYDEFSHTEIYNTAYESVLDADCLDKALIFQYSEGGTFMDESETFDNSHFLRDDSARCVEIRMASLHYIHSPSFLSDLTLCGSDIKDYLTGAMDNIKTAATEMAMGFVSKKSDHMGTSQYPLATSHLGEPSRMYGSEEDVFSMMDRQGDIHEGDDKKLVISGILQSPVIVLPRTPTSSEVLVAYLGKTYFRNKQLEEVPTLPNIPFSESFLNVEEEEEEGEKMFIEIRDIRMYSRDEKDIVESEAVNHSLPEIYSKARCGVPILHDTIIELKIEKQEPQIGYINRNSTQEFSLDENVFPQFGDQTLSYESPDTVIQISGRVVTPLKLALHRQVYEQILQTLDNLTHNNEESQSNESFQGSEGNESMPTTESSVMSVPSMSALKLDMGEVASSTSITSISSSTVSSQASNPIAIRAKFDLPIFDIEMQNDLGGEPNKSIVLVSFKDFVVDYEKSNPYITEIEVALQSLTVKDLLQDEQTKHGFLMVSKGALPTGEFAAAGETKMYMSTSCPDSMIQAAAPDMPPSLPSSLRQENVFTARAAQSKGSTASRTHRSRQEKPSEYPSTPPPTPQLSLPAMLPQDRDRGEALVHIKVQLVDRKCPEFATTYNKTNRFIDVDFNGLDTTANLNTWVVVLDFLGMGAKIHDTEAYSEKTDPMTPPAADTVSEESGEKETVNSEIELKVKSLNLLLNKKEYELAKANVSNLKCHLKLRDGNMAVCGQLGSMSLTDQSPHGVLYREKFMTTGTQALDFDIFKYGTPDPMLRREFDMSVKLRMASVRYTHSQRFISETVAFIQHFNQMQEVLGRMRASSSGQKIDEKASRGGRMKLDIVAGSPIILIPHSSKTTDILVVDLGTLTVKNTFKFADNTVKSEFTHKKKERHSSSSSVGEEPKNSTHSMPLSPKKAVDPMSMSIYGGLDTDWREDTMEATESSAISESAQTASSTSPRCNSSKPKLEKKPSLQRQDSVNGRKLGWILNPPPSYEESVEHVCLLDVLSISLEDMDLYSAERVEKGEYSSSTPHLDFVFNTCVIQRQAVKLLKQKCALNLEVERNLDGDLSHSVPDFNINGTLSSVHCSIDVNQYKLVRGLLDHNLGEAVEEFKRPLLTEMQDPKNITVLSGHVFKAIAICIELKNVSVEFLMAHEQPDCPEVSLARLDFIKSKLCFESYSDQTKDVDLVSHEIRASDTRFRDFPDNHKSSIFQEILHPTCHQGEHRALQMELHYRSTKDAVHYTALLNNMRLLCIFDWLLEVQEFLSTSPEDPFSSNFNKRHPSQHQVAVSMVDGIATKRKPPQFQEQKPMDLKLNITETEFVVVENMTTWDTKAVILKSTAVLSYRSATERPLSCSLQSLEVFSCTLNAENETALSIIDPMTVSIELSGTGRRGDSGAHGLADAAVDDRPPVLEASFNTLNIRLSYNDLKLFLAIMNSVPEQAYQAKKSKSDLAITADTIPAESKYSVEAFQSLHNLGFKYSDCELALQECGGKLDDAALWLTTNAEPVRKAKQGGAKKDDGQLGGMNISGVELKANSICLCLIDDCLDADVPLTEFTISGLSVLQTLRNKLTGKANFTLAADYYNRKLSGWEPFIESWNCTVEWQQHMYHETPEDNSLTVSVSAFNPLNINLTSPLLDLYKKTKVKWTEDYYKTESPQDMPSAGKRRVPFVPYGLKNLTGCKLQFGTTTDMTDSWGRTTYLGGAIYNWRTVMPGDEVSFLFEEKGKMRHQKTHELKVHQIVVKVDGWKTASPVSVDKVGTYFRNADAEVNTSSSLFKDLPTARLVFDIKIVGSAKKVITVRSALKVVNRLEDVVEIQVHNMLSNTEKPHIFSLDPGCPLYIPVPLVHCRLHARPRGWSMAYCQKPIYWTHVQKPGEVRDSLRSCHTVNGEGIYRFCVEVKKENFPMDYATKKTDTMAEVFMHPGHTLTLVPPTVIVNLLPIELQYYIKGTQIKGAIKPGKEKPLFAADISQAIELGILLENFPTCRELVIPPGVTDYLVKIRLYDTYSRLLELMVRIHARKGGALKLHILAPYWLVNKSGLPLLFRQDSAKTEAAGQFEEHELARSHAPLLFSFADKDAPFLCIMRLGKHVHENSLSQWCHRFSLSRGVGMRQLHVTPRDNRKVDKVYNIGIEIRQGQGRHRDTYIVTFTPRFTLDNKSSYRLAFAQRHQVTGKGPENPSGVFSAYPNSSLTFHWPRQDLDTLLCVRRMDDMDCYWSGGFFLDKVNSFHVNMRGPQKMPLFLRVDVVLQGATYFVIFSDADQMPPPYRIDNFSEVPLVVYQRDVVDDRLRTLIKPKTSWPYALDEPSLPSILACCVQGGTKAYYDLDRIGDGQQLHYENFFYIAVTGTFIREPQPGSLQPLSSDLESQMLVLDVPTDSTAVVFKRKETGKRSQLWRMTTSGLIQHEGSAVPRDPRKSPAKDNVFVLDISAIAPLPTQYVPLMLRKMDPRRRATQTWQFTEDGRLVSAFGSLSVQSRDGVTGLKDGAAVVVGPGLPLTITGSSESSTPVPVYMALGRQKMRSGSGVLAVRVIPDGPTRVLEITDLMQRDVALSDSDDYTMVTERGTEKRRSSSSITDHDKIGELKVSLNLHGVGISLVNHIPEELVYISFMDIDVGFSSKRGSQLLEMSVKNVQVDSQLFGALTPVVLFVTRLKEGIRDDSPALQISAHKVANKEWNAEIYKHLAVYMKRMTLIIEERLLWKLLQFADIGLDDSDLEQVDESDFSAQRNQAVATAIQAKRYYFGVLKIQTRRINLGMHTSTKLPPDLEAIKVKMGIPLIKFEDAKVELDPFVQYHPFETSALLINSIITHYTEELKSQAAKILGSVDFLGNPLGLVNDVTAGISGVVREGNIGGLFTNVAHGFTNSAAKVTGSLSDGLSKLTFDEQYQTVRQQIKNEGDSGGNIIAGIKGLGHGLVGGLTSIVQNTVQGYSSGGVEGMMAGLGRGMVGTVTKPVTGMLDFASHTATAMRDTSRTSSARRQNRHRSTRHCLGPGGLLPEYSEHDALAQTFLYLLNDGDYSERYIAMIPVKSGQESLRVLITSDQLYFLRHESPDMDNVTLQVPYEELKGCRVIDLVQNDGTLGYYVQLSISSSQNGGAAPDIPLRTPQIRCDSEMTAMQVTEQILYAKNLFDEKRQTVDAGEEENQAELFS
ncbi:vacuolar protein sorting-associated protein 13D-like isoform X2 [Lingula anatina]|uniref:Vacuolar protein sorting-associated protein 13D-like isoform X2 n=1 Tax=Lingula anatina TaxID=7574 RepID=A0A1S3J598_LINAN|nr:vacuolar protein sorting-associated protein 13D-like isoform X2 [Lingula anatina]|eukprot:XP_013405463.1 vacuolar protein sorting-associated protein 13D-like isoform X2 [Lingula anatina]